MHSPCRTPLDGSSSDHDTTVTMPSRTNPVLPGLFLLVSACAGGLEPATVTPEQIPALEARVRAQPSAGDAWTLLGMAYGAAERAHDARQALERAVTLPEFPAAAWAQLGVWREEASDLEGARSAYREYLRSGGPASSEVEARLGRVERELLSARARAAIAREAELAGEPADPRTVAVLPLTVDGPAQYAPLGVGLADLLTTDLSVTGRLSVLERAQLAALLDETRLALAGFTDAGSAARVGRLMRAGRLIQGRIAIAQEGGETQLLALVVDANDPSSPGEALERGALETLMDMEVQLALEIYRQLGVQLTAAERARLEQKPTRNLQAFLAYSEGLQLLDAGDFGGAAARFEAAAGMDPGFDAATSAAERARRIGAVTPADVRRSAMTELVQVAGGGPAEEGALDAMVDAAVPAGTGATATGAGSGSGSTQTTSVENTETTAGTGLSQVVRIPIILTRPQPLLLFPMRIP